MGSSGQGGEPQSHATAETIREFVAHPYQTLAPDGRITSVNDAWLEVLGYERSAVEGRPFSDFLGTDSAERFESRFEAFKRTGSVSGLECELIDADGERVSVSVDGRMEYDDGEAVRAHVQFVDISERREYETTLTTLHHVADEVVDETTVDGVCRLIVDAAENILEFDRSVFAVETDGRLEVRAAAGGLSPDDYDTFGVDEGIAGKTYRTGESFLVDDVADHPEAKPQTAVASLISLPVGTHGNFQAVAHERNAFDESDLDLARLLVNHAETALDRLEDEQRLQRQRDDLELLNQVLRHDVRNDLQLTVASADALADDVDGEQGDRLGTLLEAAEDAVELIETAGAMADVLLEPDRTTERVSLRAVLETELADLRETHPDAEVVVADELPDVTVRADGMLSSVFSNVLKNAVQHSDRDVPTVTLSAERTGDAVLVRVADDGPGVPDARKEGIFGKGEAGLDSAGTGIGLYLVRTLVEGYGGAVEVRDNDPRGAVFEVELPVATPD
ncbi:MAG: ATP-binding protein [Halobacteriales archaeon]